LERGGGDYDAIDAPTSATTSPFDYRACKHPADTLEAQDSTGAARDATGAADALLSGLMRWPCRIAKVRVAGSSPVIRSTNVALSWPSGRATLSVVGCGCP